MLLQNKSFLSCNGLRYFAGAPAVSGVLARSLLSGQIASRMNRFIGEANFYKGDSTPTGHSPTGGAWYPNRITGGMGTRSQIIGSATMAILLAKGLGGASRMTGSGTIVTLPRMKYAYHFIADVASLTSLGEISNTSAMKGLVEFKVSDNIELTGQGTFPVVMLKILAWSKADLAGESAVVSDLIAPLKLMATLVGEGEVSSAILVGLVQLMSTLTGEGELDPGLRFPANLSAELEGEGILEETMLKVIAWCVSNILAAGTATGSDLRGDAYMSTNITSAGELVTAQSCAIAVWNALAASYNVDGTMGKAVNSAGTAGDPWTGLLENYTDDATFGAYMKKLLTKLDFLTLK